MQTSEIMVINRLATGTAFATTVDSNQAVFIPAKITALLDANVGDRFKAILIANTAMPEKTPWMAIRLDRINGQATASVTMGSDLADMIMADLQDGGMATVEDIADAIDYPIASVVAKMQEMARRGQIYRRTFYAVNECDFIDGVDE